MVVINENLTGIYKGVHSQVGKLCRRHIGATGYQVQGLGFGVAVQCQRQVLPNRFRLSSYSSVSIGVVIAAIVARGQQTGFVPEDFAGNMHLPPNGTAQVMSQLVLAVSLNLMYTRGLCGQYTPTAQWHGVGYVLAYLS